MISGFSESASRNPDFPISSFLTSFLRLLTSLLTSEFEVLWFGLFQPNPGAVDSAGLEQSYFAYEVQLPESHEESQPNGCEVSVTQKCEDSKEVTQNEV